MRNLVKYAGAAALLTSLAVLGIGSAVWIWDTMSDRRHVVVTISATPFLLSDPGERCSNNQSRGTIPGMAELRVRRIRYYKECMVVRARNADGRDVYRVTGLGEFQVR